MILELQLWKAKPGRRDDLAALGKALGACLGVPARVYTPLTHPGALVIFEFTFADLAQQASAWAACKATPEGQQLQARLREMVEPEHRSELYRQL